MSALPPGYISWSLKINKVQFELVNFITACNIWYQIHNIAKSNNWIEKKNTCTMHRYASSFEIPNDFYIYKDDLYDIEDLKYELQWVKNMTR